MKQDNNNNSRITLANFISFGLGLAAFAVFFWLGLHFTGFELSTSLLCSLGATILFGVLLWFLIRAKGVDRDRKRWRVIEYVTLGVYVVLAALSVWPMSRFFSVNSQSDEIKALAMEDVRNIEHLMKDFQDQETESLNRTVTGMQTYVSGRRANGPSDEIERFFENPEHKASMNDVGVEAYRSTWSRHINDYILGDKVFGATWRAAIQEADREIASWNILKVPSSVVVLENLSVEISTTLTEMSESFPFPLIENRKIEKPNQARRYGIPMVKAKNAFDNIGNLSASGILISLLIHLVILFNYFIANRSRRIVAADAGRANTGGVLLKNK
ncbi:MAG: hypothetical protein IJ692_04085 [Alloprevotella sp.]|nr:hypothetical protein [Alloprevotella sp.]